MRNGYWMKWIQGGRKINSFLHAANVVSCSVWLSGNIIVDDVALLCAQAVPLIRLMSRKFVTNVGLLIIGFSKVLLFISRWKFLSFLIVFLVNSWKEKKKAQSLSELLSSSTRSRRVGGVNHTTPLKPPSLIIPQRPPRRKSNMVQLAASLYKKSVILQKYSLQKVLLPL